MIPSYDTELRVTRPFSGVEFEEVYVVLVLSIVHGQLGRLILHCLIAGWREKAQ